MCVRHPAGNCSAQAKNRNSPERHIQLVIQELRDMDRIMRSAVKHQQRVVEASLIECRRSELLTKLNNKKLMEERMPNK
jgi:hypothetical protein